MSSPSRTSRNSDKRIPVFVFPEELEFIEEERTSHKQVLTLYNPYDFNVRFEIFSTAPKKYAVVESKGCIKAHHCVDIVVRHMKIGLEEGPYGVKDKFRIHMYTDKKVLIGRKLVSSTLIKEKNKEDTPRNGRQVEHFKTLEQVASSQCTVEQRQSPRLTSEQSPSVLMVVIALLCLMVLLFPLEGESHSWPSYLHITVNQKLIAAFALGLVTMAILKS